MQPPADYRGLKTSNNQQPAAAKRLGPSDPKRSVAISIGLRRRSGAPPLPSLEDLAKQPFSKRPYCSREDFATTFGASQDDADIATRYFSDAGLEVLRTNLPGRHVRVRGTVAQLEAAFFVQLHDYEIDDTAYHGYEGQLSLPESLTQIVEAVLGLDGRPRFKPLNVPPPPPPPGSGSPGAVPVTPLQVAQLYNFPIGPTVAENQIIGIVSIGAAYNPDDISQYFSKTGPGAGLVQPTVLFPDPQLPAMSSNPVSSDYELTMDITISSSIAQGATIAVYPWPPNDPTAALIAAVHPTAGSPIPTVISISFGGAEVDPIGDSVMMQWSSLFQDAAMLGVTVLVAAGDKGCSGGNSAGRVSVYYPASDPGVIACGGTMISSAVHGRRGWGFYETTWNDSYLAEDPNRDVTGGGVSMYFPLPSWQNGTNVPPNYSTQFVGRGLPDIAGNASSNSPYIMVFYKINDFYGSGTSAVAPLYAGLIAIINCALGTPVGFITPTLYQLGVAGLVFRDVDDGMNNQVWGLNPPSPYVSSPGWDPCTGWGSLNGKRLISVLTGMSTQPPFPLIPVTILPPGFTLTWDGITTQVIGGFDDGGSIIIIYQWGVIIKIIPRPPVFVPNMPTLSTGIAAFLALVSLASMANATTDAALNESLNAARLELLRKFGDQMLRSVLTHEKA